MAGYSDKWPNVKAWMESMQPHLVLCGKHDKQGNWIPKAPYQLGWEQRPALLSEVLRHLDSGKYVGVVPSSLRSAASPCGLVVVDVDTGPSGVKYDGMDDACRYVASVLGDPAADCQTANGGRHLYYVVSEPMDWTRHPWRSEGHGGGDIIYSRQQVVLYEPSVVFAAAANPTGSAVTREQLYALRGVQEDVSEADRPRAIETSADKDRQAATASLEWISPDVEYNDWMRVGASLYHGLGAEGFALWDDWSRRGTKYQPGECEKKWPSFARQGGARVGISTLIWIARDNGMPRN